MKAHCIFVHSNKGSLEQQSRLLNFAIFKKYLKSWKANLYFTRLGLSISPSRYIDFAMLLCAVRDCQESKDGSNIFHTVLKRCGLKF